MRSWAKVFLALGLLGGPVHARAWGHAGHQAIALLAQKRLSPKAQAWVRENLQGESIEAAAVWPDLISHRRTETAPWHYINLPVAREDGPRQWQKYCGKEGCLVSAIQDDIQLLQNRSASPAQRKEALRFLIHFIGDIHQPLHCADDKDRGGNDKTVYVRGRGTSLHQLWDDALLAHRSAKTELVTRFIEKKLLDQALARAAKQGSVEDWLQESATLARERIYPLFRERRGNLSKEDLATWQPLVDQQLVRATVRLAQTLENLASKP